MSGLVAFGSAFAAALAYYTAIQTNVMILALFLHVLSGALAGIAFVALIACLAPLKKSRHPKI